MKFSMKLVALGLAGALVGAACSTNSADGAASGQAPPTSGVTATDDPQAVEPTEAIDPVVFRRQMRGLWEDHVAWTRLFIVSAVADLPDTEATAGRLLQNQADIGDAVAGFYGEPAGAALTDLLNDHILIAGDIITAAKAGDDTGVQDGSAAWYANADEISVFLADANPAWPVEVLTDMMHGHLDQTLREATAQLTGDYEASVAEYDQIVTHILDMADALTAGIITQFPEQF